MTYHPEAQVAEWSDLVLANGEKMLAPFRLAASEAMHALSLQGLLRRNPPQKVLDAGGGMGALSDHLSTPEFQVDLLNISQAQLDRADPRHVRILGDIERMPVPAGSYDGVIFQYCLGHVDIRKALAEAWRIIRPDGSVMIVDMWPANAGAAEFVAKTQQYALYPRGYWYDALEAAGFDCIEGFSYGTKHPSPTYADALGAQGLNLMRDAVRPFVTLARREY